MKIDIGQVTNIDPEKGTCTVRSLSTTSPVGYSYINVPYLFSNLAGVTEAVSSSTAETINKEFYDDRGVDFRFVSEGEYNRITPGSIVVLLVDDEDRVVVLGCLTYPASQIVHPLIGGGLLSKPSLKSFLNGIYNRFSWNLPTIKKHWFGSPKKEEQYKETRPFFVAARDTFWFVRRKAKNMFVSLYKIAAEILRISAIYTLPNISPPVNLNFDGKLPTKGGYEKREVSEAMLSLDTDGRIFIGSEYKNSSADLQSNKELKYGLGTYIVLNDFVTEVSGKQFLLERGEHINIKGENRILLECQKEKVELSDSKFNPNNSGLIAQKSPYFSIEGIEGNIEGVEKITIKVGSSTITLTPLNITIESPSITIKGGTVTIIGETTINGNPII